jgi:hypothetical protein
MRLIDADKLLECFDSNTWQGDMMISIVKNIDVTYDIDKVIEQLEELHQSIDSDDWYTSGKIYDAIEIAKKGGIE